MKVENKEMYHLHKNTVFNDIWTKGNEIIIDDNFNSYYSIIFNFFNTSVKTTDGLESFDQIIDSYLKEEQDKEMYIRMLKEARKIIVGMNVFKREMALEEIRKELYPSLPSRKHSIWLCDEKGIDFWKKELIGEVSDELDLFKVSVSGNLFKSSDSFIPSNENDYGKNLKEAKNYWNPKFETEEEEKKAEYLFQGRVKILEKIDTIKNKKC